MRDNPYDILGITPDATPAEIKAAYRRIVRQNHPDLCPGDSMARARFMAASRAYEALLDGSFSAGSDQPEATVYAQPAPQPAEGDEDILAHLFGGRNEQGGYGDYRAGPDSTDSFDLGRTDLHCTTEVDFVDMARGGQAYVTLPGGTALSLHVPEGVRDGQTLRLRGQGASTAENGPAGDAYVTISVRPHAAFRRLGDDVHLTLPITLDEAILGARVPVPTPDGPVGLTVPKGASTGRKLRLPGYGISPFQGGERGDQFVELQVILPNGTGEDPADYVRKWRQLHAVAPTSIG